MTELETLRFYLDFNKIAYTNKSLKTENDGLDILKPSISVVFHKNSIGKKMACLK